MFYILRIIHTHTHMNVAIVGSRTFDNYQKLKTELDNLQVKCPINKIISGGARGADSLAARYANANQITLLEYIPDWKTHGRKAGILRNYDIVREADMVIAFWDGISKGTKHSIGLGQRLHKDVIIYKFEKK